MKLDRLAVAVNALHSPVHRYSTDASHDFLPILRDPVFEEPLENISHTGSLKINTNYKRRKPRTLKG